MTMKRFRICFATTLVAIIAISSLISCASKPDKRELYERYDEIVPIQPTYPPRQLQDYRSAPLPRQDKEIILEFRRAGRAA